MTDSARHDFLKAQLFQMTVSATMQRNKVYADDAPVAARDSFRAALRKQLAQVSDTYSADISDQMHEQAIMSLADTLSGSHGAILESKRFRIGTAQKALNLWLKYLWCAGFLTTEPLHCPFDRIIIQKLSMDVRSVSWTSLDRISDYQRLVTAARIKAGKLSLAQWELTAYNSTMQFPQLLTH
jgi:hypothetical protein